MRDMVDNDEAHAVGPGLGIGGEGAGGGYILRPL
jgi:hypothetical protein